MLLISRDDKGTTTNDGEKFNDWEQVINKGHMRAWRKPVPNSYLYEYKGTVVQKCSMISVRIGYYEYK